MKNPLRLDSIFLGLGSFQALAMFRRGIFYTFLAVYLRSGLGLSVTETTLFETVPMVLNVLFQTFVWGRLTDRLQKRRTLIIVGELLASVGHVAMWYLHAIAPTPRAAGYIVIAGLTVIEIFWSMSNIGWSAYISDAYSIEERNTVQGRFASLGGLGRIVGALMGGLLYDGMGRAEPGWGYRAGGIFFASAAVMAVSVIPLFFMPEGGVGLRGKEAERDGEKALGTGNRGGLAVFATFLAAMLLINSGLNTLGAFRAQYLDLAEGFAASPSAISLAVNVEAAVLIIVGLLVGGLGRRFGIRAVLASGAAAGIASLILHAAAPSLGVVYLGAAFKGLAEGCIAAASYAYASTLIPPERRGRYFAYYNATFFLSWGLAATFLTGPLIDGLMAAGHGPVLAYRAGLASGAILMALGLGILMALFAMTRRRDQALR